MLLVVSLLTNFCDHYTTSPRQDARDTQLCIHLEDGQTVTFRSSDDPTVTITRGKHTKLTRFFELCASEAPENQIAKSTLYQDIPKLFK